MKYELRKGTLGIIDWLTRTQQNKLLLGGDYSLADVAEACWVFTLPLDEIEKMTQQKVKAEVKHFMADLEAETFSQLQKHAEVEIKKFFSTDVRPKKPRPQGMKKKVARR
jgi:glutathione S-transferase